MKLIKGDLWDADVDVYAVTTNCYIKKDGSLAMGGGAAKQALLRYPDVALEAGRFITRNIPHNTSGWREYNWCSIITLCPLDFSPVSIGLFQTKYHFKDPTPVELLERSTLALRDFARRSGCSIALNFPGIGLGKLSKQIVLPIIHTLPDNVHVYYLEEE